MRARGRALVGLVARSRVRRASARCRASARPLGGSCSRLRLVRAFTRPRVLSVARALSCAQVNCGYDGDGGCCGRSTSAAPLAAAGAVRPAARLAEVRLGEVRLAVSLVGRVRSPSGSTRALARLLLLEWRPVPLDSAACCSCCFWLLASASRISASRPGACDFLCLEP